MLSLFIDGQPIDLKNDFSFTMNLKSPFFNDLGNYSYPFKIPNTPRNAKLLGFRHRVENTADPYSGLQGAFKWNNLDLFSGTVLMKILSGESFEGTIYEGNGDFYYSTKNKSLQNIDFGKLDFEDSFSFRSYINNSREKCYPEVIVGFPNMFNPLYFDPPTEDPGQTFYNPYELGYIMEYTPGPGSNRNVIVPMLYLRHVLDKIFEYLEFNVEDTFFEKWPEFNKCVIYNSVNCNEGAGGFFGYPPYHIYFNYHLPQISIIDFLSGIETFLNIRFVIDNKRRTVKIVSMDTMVKAPDYIDFSNKFFSLVTSLEEQIRGFLLKMTTDGSDPEMELQTSYDDTISKLIKATVEKVSDLPLWPGAEESEMRWVTQANSYYKMHNHAWSIFDINDLLMATQFIYKERGTTLETKFSTMSGMRSFGGQDEARCKNAMASWRDITPRVLFNKEYFESGYFYSMNASCFYDNVSFLYQGETGLFANFFQAYFDFRMRTKLVKITLKLDYPDLAGFDFSKKIMVNGVKYLVKSIQVVFKKNEIAPAVLECYLI